MQHHLNFIDMKVVFCFNRITRERIGLMTTKFPQKKKKKRDRSKKITNLYTEENQEIEVELKELGIKVYLSFKNYFIRNN